MTCTQTLSHIGENITESAWELDELNEAIRTRTRNKALGPKKSTAQPSQWLNTIIFQLLERLSFVQLGLRRIWGVGSLGLTVYVLL